MVNLDYTFQKHLYLSPDIPHAAHLGDAPVICVCEHH